MAATVRSWVLEMAMKQQSRIDSPKKDHDYGLLIKVEEHGRETLSSCGPLTFIKGQAQQHDGHQPGGSKKALLLGPPSTSKQEQQLQPASLIGIRRGLLWDLQLNTDEGPEQWIVGIGWDILGHS